MSSQFVDVKTNLKKVNKSLRKMDKAVNQAFLSSINRASQRAKTETGRKVRERYIVKQKEVTETITVKKAKGNLLTAVLTSKGRTLPLIKFGVTPKKRLKRPPKAVKASVFRSGGKKPIPGAFIASDGGRIGVFEREGKKRLPIRELRGPAVPQMAYSEEVREHVQQVYGEEMQKRLPHELARTIGKVMA